MLTRRGDRLLMGASRRPACDDDEDCCERPSVGMSLLVAVGGAVIGAVLSPLAERAGTRLADRFMPPPKSDEEEDHPDDVSVPFDDVDAKAFRSLLDRERERMDNDDD